MIRLLPLFLVLVSAVAPAEYESQLRDAGSLGGIHLAGTEDPNARKVYIVQLKDPAAAGHHAILTGAAVKSGVPGASRGRLDKASAAVQGYTAQLAEKQSAVFAKAGAGAELIYSYRYSLNGFAAKMHPSQAHKIESLPEVLHVWEDEIRPLATKYSLDFLGLFDADVGLRGAPGLDGEDIIIGVIDSGIAPEHRR